MLVWNFFLYCLPSRHSFSSGMNCSNSMSCNALKTSVAVSVFLLAFWANVLELWGGRKGCTPAFCLGAHAGTQCTWDVKGWEVERANAWGTCIYKSRDLWSINNSQHTILTPRPWKSGTITYADSTMHLFHSSTYSFSTLLLKPWAQLFTTAAHLNHYTYYKTLYNTHNHPVKPCFMNWWCCRHVKVNTKHTSVVRLTMLCSIAQTHLLPCKWRSGRPWTAWSQREALKQSTQTSRIMLPLLVALYYSEMYERRGHSLIPWLS